MHYSRVQTNTPAQKEHPQKDLAVSVGNTYSSLKTFNIITSKTGKLTARHRVPRCELVDLFFLKREIFENSLNIHHSKQTFVTQISASGWGVPGTTYFEMGVRGQIHVTLRVLDIKKLENH